MTNSKHLIQYNMNTTRCLFAVLLAMCCITLNAQVKMDRTTKECRVQFFTNFESGSLDSASVKEIMAVHPQMEMPQEKFVFDIFSRFDPENPADPTLPPSARWYHFLMTGVKGKEIQLNVHNSDARRPFYSYNGKDYMRFSEQECMPENTICKKYGQDSVYIAYFTPYPESYFNSRIAQWNKRDCVETISIGKSEHGRNMPLLVVTDKNADNNNKKIVYIHGRTHTSETPGSWHLDQMIETLTGESQYAKDLRKYIVFYILPFTNPDGVQEGMSRSNSNGINLEVNWNYPDSLTAQEVKNMKNFLSNLVSNGKSVDIVLNMHSQSLNQTTYWVHKAATTSDRYYKDLMLFSNLTIDRNPYFRKDDLKFSNVSPKYLEGWFWENCKEKSLAITFETPYTFYNNKRDGEWVSLENLRAMAINNIHAIGDYLQVPTSERITVSEPAKGKGFKKATDMQHIFFGDSYLIAKKAGAKVKYRLKSLPAGVYTIYKWNAGENLTVSKEGENEWIEIGKCTQAKDGKFKYRHTAKNAGERADNILLVKKK